MQQEDTESETHIDKSLLEINRDRILSKISNKMTEQLLQYVPQFMGNLIVENIEVKTKGRTKSTKFDVAFVLDSFKPYVEIVKKINEVDVIKIKTVFQIDSDIKMLGVKFSVTENKKKISLGKIIVHISITLIASAGILSTERVLREDTFEADLTGIDLTL